MGNAKWQGCGECDEVFSCNDGKDRCIRLPKEGPISIGEYTLSPGMAKGRVWIEHKSGEGGDFDPEKLEVVIKKFYTENF